MHVTVSGNCIVNKTRVNRRVRGLVVSVVTNIYEAETKLFRVNNKHVKHLSVVHFPHCLTSFVKVDHVCPFCLYINSQNWTLEVGEIIA